jgi:pimeloyl-ACP methyl ester carboxylesterase
MYFMTKGLNPKIPFFNRLVEQVEKGEYSRLDDKVAEIKLPACVIWGEANPVVPLEYSPAYHDGLSNSQLRILERPGNSSKFEIPDVTQV